jgi:hypothetical protein
VSLAVSAWATDLRLKDGKLRFPRISGNEFVAIGIPRGHRGEYPTPPEQAVVSAAGQSGERIASLPQLITSLKWQGLPQQARWRMKLERPVAAQVAAGIRNITEVLIAPSAQGSLQSFVAAPDQPTTVDIKWWPVPTDGESRHAYRARIPSQPFITRVSRRVDMPVAVESFTREDR